jgi:hypothetical protein
VLDVNIDDTATNSACLNGCTDPHWDMSRRELNLMKDIFSSCYKGTPSVTTHKLNVSITYWYGHVFSCFVMRNSCPKFVRTCQLHFVCGMEAMLVPLIIYRALK